MDTTSIQNTNLYCADLDISHETGSTYSYLDVVDLRILVLTFNRPLSLQHTLNSLKSLVLDDSIASLEIWIDCSSDGRVDFETYSTAMSFTWVRGITRVHVWRSHVGLYGQWIDTWTPQDNCSELALLVEDDIDIAPYAWRWIRAAHNHYSWMGQISGYALKDEDLSSRARRVIRLDSVFMRRHNLPWGYSPIPSVWRKFQDWYAHMKNNSTFHPYIKEDKRHTRWYKSLESKGIQNTMWTQWFHYFTHKYHMYCVFPNVRVISGSNQGFEFNRREKGLHFSNKQTKQSSRSHLINTWQKEYIAFPNNTKILNYNDRLYGIIEVSSGTKS